MADTGGGDKTEKATPQKLRKAREQGQVVRSKDLATAIGILVGLKLFVFLLPGYMESFRAMFALVFAPMGETGALENALSLVFPAAMALLVKMVLPLLTVPLAIMAGALVPGGWVVSSTNLLPRFDRFSPLKNIGNLFQAKQLTTVGTSILKALVLGVVLYYVASDSTHAFVELQRLPFNEAMVKGANMMLDGVMAMVMVFLLFAVIDVPLQAFLFARNQRMSKQEVKDEHKTTEGKPEVRQRIKQLQHQIARRSVKKTVPSADVVIVNPQHYAVALKYDVKRAEAPFVVAKGLDEMALYIRRVAQEHKVEVLTLPPLARAIYNTSQVQQQIPAALYQAVSQVLNYVLQLNAFRSGRRQAPPRFPNEVPVPPHLSEV